MRLFLKILAWYSVVVEVLVVLLNLYYFALNGDVYGLKGLLWNFPIALFLILLLSGKYLSKTK